MKTPFLKDICKGHYYDDCAIEMYSTDDNFDQSHHV